MDLGDLKIPERSAIPLAARRFAKRAHDLAGLRVFALCSIEGSHHIRDADGRYLASSEFGWSQDLERLWRSPHFGSGCPTRTVARVDNRPCWLNAAGAHGLPNNPYVPQIDCTSLPGRWQLKSCILAPVYLPFGQIGQVLFCCEDDARDDLSREFSAFGQELSRMATVFISDYYSLETRGRELVADPKLTRRERECLSWAGQGKTDEDTATIMAIGRSTVRFHIQNALKKLNACNRAQAVARATQLGYLPSA